MCLNYDLRYRQSVAKVQLTPEEAQLYSGNPVVSPRFQLPRKGIFRVPDTITFPDL